MNKLMEKTIKELREMVKKQGIENAEVFTTKAQLIAILDDAKSRTPGVAQPESPEDVERYKSKRQKMKEYLEAQPKVSIMLPLEGKERAPDNPVHPVTINGFTTLVPKGKMTEVPKDVAKLIGNYLAAKSGIDEPFRLDRSKDVKDALT